MADWAGGVGAKARELADAQSELWKQLANDPVTGLQMVQRHVREKGLPDLARVKTHLLLGLTALREAASEARQLEVEREALHERRQGEGEPKSALGDAAGTFERLTNRVDVLRQRIEIMADMGERLPDTPKRVGRKSRSSGEPLPVGFGQHLDNCLLNGEMDVDQYSESIARLAQTYSDMQEEDDGK